MRTSYLAIWCYALCFAYCKTFAEQSALARWRINSSPHFIWLYGRQSFYKLNRPTKPLRDSARLRLVFFRRVILSGAKRSRTAKQRQTKCRRDLRRKSSTSSEWHGAAKKQHPPNEWCSYRRNLNLIWTYRAKLLRSKQIISPDRFLSLPGLVVLFDKLEFILLFFLKFIYAIL